MTHKPYWRSEKEIEGPREQLDCIGREFGERRHHQNPRVSPSSSDMNPRHGGDESSSVCTGSTSGVMSTSFDDFGGGFVTCTGETATEEDGQPIGW